MTLIQWDNKFVFQKWSIRRVIRSVRKTGFKLKGISVRSRGSYFRSRGGFQNVWRLFKKCKTLLQKCVWPLKTLERRRHDLFRSLKPIQNLTSYLLRSVVASWESSEDSCSCWRSSILIQKSLKTSFRRQRRIQRVLKRLDGFFRGYVEIRSWRPI